MELRRINGELIGTGHTILKISEEKKLYLRNADLRNADLRNADLRSADLTGAYLRGADLRSADIRGAVFSDAYLRNADLRSADIRGAVFSDAYLRNADLTGAYLRGADLRSADLSDAKIEFYLFPCCSQLASIQLGKLPDNLTLELMRRDAYGHPHPERFDDWASGGNCPYENEQRAWFFAENRKLWKPGPPTMTDRDLVLAICKAKQWGIRKYLPLDSF